MSESRDAIVCEFLAQGNNTCACLTLELAMQESWMFPISKCKSLTIKLQTARVRMRARVRTHTHTHTHMAKWQNGKNR